MFAASRSQRSIGENSRGVESTAPPGFLVDEDQLMARAVERAHAAVRLDPNAEIDGRKFGAPGGSLNRVNMTPVHEDIGQRALRQDVVGGVQEIRQEFCEFGRGQFARRHGELTVFNPASTTHMPLDGHVVRRIGEQQAGLLVAKQPFVGVASLGVAAKQTVRTEVP